MSSAMLRKVAVCLLALALVLVGFGPIGGPAAGGVTAAAELQQLCCADCDQPMVPDDLGCPAMIGCVATPTFSMLPSEAAAAYFATSGAQSASDRTGAPPTDVSPPFRPPRFSILA